jgi:hypothetical protein
VRSDKAVKKGRARREGAKTQTEMGECGDVRKMRKTWGLLLGCWGGSEDEDEEKPRTSGRAGGYALSRTGAERGSSGTVDDSQCGTPDDPLPSPKAFFFYFFYRGVVEGPKVLYSGVGVLDP